MGRLASGEMGGNSRWMSKHILPTESQANRSGYGSALDAERPLIVSLAN